MRKHIAVFTMFALIGCAAEGPDEDLDPAGSLGDEQMSDEGPTLAEESSDANLPTDVIEATTPFQLPFPCGQVWAGQTRTNHSPTNSVDFNRLNDSGDTVVAAKAGRVSRVANAGNVSYGRWIEINHGNGYTTRYAHLSRQVVSVGQSVAQGQKIGEVGSTGGSTGPHLHYEVRLNGVAIRASFDGRGALYFGTRNYTSQNRCGNAGGGTTGHVGRINTAGAPLTVRAGASTNTAAVGSVSDGATVRITCQKRGQ
ncbi:MAG: M23 family metallopeptidase, partial [Myxococcales bacterium]|nr:M23 family metallopeptidase [Myxococcales bacterium]